MDSNTAAAHPGGGSKKKRWPRKPKGIVPPCGFSRESRIQWLTSYCRHAMGSNYRVGRSSGPWFLSWSVKLHGLDLSLENLIKIHKADYDVPRITSKIRAKHEEVMENDTLYQWAVEDACSTFVGRGGEVPDDDAYNTLWNGDSVSTKFAFLGRSGGWLVMTEFEGFVLDTDIEWDTMSYRTLRGLCEMAWFVGSHLEPRASVERCAAFTFFKNSCARL